MKNLLLKFVAFTVVIFACLMAVSGNEGVVKAFEENRWTARREPDDFPGRYVLLSNPGPKDKVLAYERRHFGWPFWAFYFDSSVEHGFWYGKIDIPRLAANLCIAAVPAALASFALVIRRKRRKNSRELSLPAV